MFELIFTTVVSTATTIFTAVLPLVAAATGRNALKADMEIYQQWGDVLRNEGTLPPPPGGATPAGDDSGGAGACPLPSQDPGPAAVEDPLARRALLTFRRSIELKLIMRAKTGGKGFYLYGGVLLALFGLYVVCQVAYGSEGYLDDLLRSFVYFALAFGVVSVYEITRLRKVSRQLREEMLDLTPAPPAAAPQGAAGHGDPPAPEAAGEAGETAGENAKTDV